MGSPSSTLLPGPDADEQAFASNPGTYRSRGAQLPEPHVQKMRGPKLVLLWLVLMAGAWLLLGGIGYGLYVAGRSLLG
jgi:hypothetical protein